MGRSASLLALVAALVACDASSFPASDDVADARSVGDAGDERDTAGTVPLDIVTVRDIPAEDTDVSANDAGEPDACIPQCAGIMCGPDGCGGSCGTCPDGCSCVQGHCPGLTNMDWSAMCVHAPPVVLAGASFPVAVLFQVPNASEEVDASVWVESTEDGVRLEPRPHDGACAQWPDCGLYDEYDRCARDLLVVQTLRAGAPGPFTIHVPDEESLVIDVVEGDLTQPECPDVPCPPTLAGGAWFMQHELVAWPDNDRNGDGQWRLPSSCIPDTLQSNSLGEPEFVATDDCRSYRLQMGGGFGSSESEVVHCREDLVIFESSGDSSWGAARCRFPVPGGGTRDLLLNLLIDRYTDHSLQMAIVFERREE